MSQMTTTISSNNFESDLTNGGGPEEQDTLHIEIQQKIDLIKSILKEDRVSLSY